MPADWPRDARYSVELHVAYATRHPRDIDNAAKMVGDALNTVVWADDSQIDRWLIMRGTPDRAKAGVMAIVTVNRGDLSRLSV